MKSIRTRIIALLSVCAIGMICSACGKSSSDNEDSSGDNSVADVEMKQDMTIYDYEVEDSDSTPVNKDVSQSDSSTTDDDSETGGDNDVDSEESYIIVTDEEGNTVTDENGTAVTEAVSNRDSSGSSSSSSSSSNGSSSSSSSSGSSSSSNGSSDNSSNDDSTEYVASLVGKQVYWMDMSTGKDYAFNGDFVDVTFRVKDNVADGNYEISIGACDFANYDAETITYNSTNGYVTVGDVEAAIAETSGDGTIQLTCESVTAEVGNEITIHFQISDNPGIVAFIFRFTYDQNALEFVSYDVGEDCADIISLAS